MRFSGGSSSIRRARLRTVEGFSVDGYELTLGVVTPRRDDGASWSSVKHVCHVLAGDRVEVNSPQLIQLAERPQHNHPDELFSQNPVLQEALSGRAKA